MSANFGFDSSSRFPPERGQTHRHTKLPTQLISLLTHGYLADECNEITRYIEVRLDGQPQRLYTGSASA